MSWMELSLHTTHEAVDWVCTLLADTIDIANLYISQYNSSDRNPTDPQWTFTIDIYIPYDNYSRIRIEKITNLLLPLHRTSLATEIQVTIVEEKPPQASRFNSLVHRIGQRFVILTADAVYETQTADEVTLRLEKSLAFGSGLHPATIISLKLLERHVTSNMNVLDLGSGSGILSVAIAKMGANVLALDNDLVAVQATQDAVSRNGVEQQVKVMEGSLGSGSQLGHWMSGEHMSNNVPAVEANQTFDLIVANILARVHIALANDFRYALRQTATHSGLLITSGFTTDYEDSVTTALKEVGFEVIDCERLGEWVGLTHCLN